MLTATPALTVPEVADRLRVTQSTVKRWLRTGLLTGYQPSGRAWLVYPTDLERFVTKQPQ